MEIKLLSGSQQIFYGPSSISTCKPRPYIPAVAASNAAGMLIQEPISSGNESKPTLASGLAGDCYNQPSKRSGTRLGLHEEKVLITIADIQQRQ